MTGLAPNPATLGPTRLTHPSGSEQAIYDQIRPMAELGFKSLGVFDWVENGALRRPAITKIYQRCVSLGINFIPGAVLLAKNMQDRSAPEIWGPHIEEIRWWKKRGVRYWNVDVEDTWGMASQDDENGNPLQTVEQVYQSATALRHGLAAIMREGVTPCIHGPFWVKELNPRAMLLMATLAAQWPTGARCFHFLTDWGWDTHPLGNAIIRMTGHKAMTNPMGASAAEFMKSAVGGFDYCWYSPAWDFAA